MNFLVSIDTSVVAPSAPVVALSVAKGLNPVKFMSKKKNYSREAKKAVKAVKKYPVVMTVIILLVVVIVGCAVALWFLRPDIYHKFLGTGEHKWGSWQITVAADCGNDGARIRECEWCGEKEDEVIPASGNHTPDGEGVCTVCGADTQREGTLADVGESELSIHFLELGNKYTGDCTLIKCGDVEVLIDAGSRKSSAAVITEYVNRYCTDGILEYVIATHAHRDHIAGFVGNSKGDTRDGILYSFQVETLIQFAGHKTTSAIYGDYCDAVAYAKTRGTKVFTALECWNNSSEFAQRSYFLNEEKTVSMNILYNYYYEHPTVGSTNENDYSVCMLLKEQLDGGGKSRNYLFTGDLEERGESYLVDNNVLPEVDLFKGGHHGSYTASTEKLLEVIKPKNVAVCCCCGTTEYKPSVGHEFPAQEFIDRISVYTEYVYCTTLITDYSAEGSAAFTSMNGNIVFFSKGGKLKLYCSNNTKILKETEWFKNNRTWGKTG